MMGRWWGGEWRRVETVDLPVAREPVRPMRIMVWDEVAGDEVGVLESVGGGEGGW